MEDALTGDVYGDTSYVDNNGYTVDTSTASPVNTGLSYSPAATYTQIASQVSTPSTPTPSWWQSLTGALPGAASTAASIYAATTAGGKPGASTTTVINPQTGLPVTTTTTPNSSMTMMLAIGAGILVLVLFLLPKFRGGK